MIVYAPPSPGVITAAKETLQDTRLMTGVDRRQRADLVAVSFAILRDARAARLGPRPEPEGPATIHYLTAAEFRQGHQPTRRRPRLIVLPSGGPTPGDAA